MSQHQDQRASATIFDDRTPTVPLSDAPAGADLPAVYRPMPPVASVAPELDFLARVSQGQQRDEAQMIKRARRVGEMLGERATYDFPAGGGRVSGPTVGLAEALAAEWGHLWWGTRIESQEGDRVQLVAVVVDALRCTVCTRPGVFTLAPAPGKFSAKADQTARWEAMQTQVAISKCQRTALLHALPDWFIQAALDGAAAHVSKDVLGDRTLTETQDATVAAFATMGVTVDQLEARMGSGPVLWTISDIVELRALFKAIRSGNQTIAAAFKAAAPATQAPKASGLAGVGEAAEKRKGSGSRVEPVRDVSPSGPHGPDGERDPGADG